MLVRRRCLSVEEEEREGLELEMEMEMGLGLGELLYMRSSGLEERGQGGRLW